MLFLALAIFGSVFTASFIKWCESRKIDTVGVIASKLPVRLPAGLGIGGVGRLAGPQCRNGWLWHRRGDALAQRLPCLLLGHPLSSPHFLVHSLS